MNISKNDHAKIDCKLEQDRDVLVCILARNGYTVRQGHERRDQRSFYTDFVEFWKGDEMSSRI